MANYNKCIQRKNDNLTYTMETFPDEQSSIRLEQQCDHHPEDNDDRYYSNKRSREDTVNDMAYPSSMHCTYTEPNAKITHPLESHSNARNVFYKSSSKPLTPGIDHCSSESLYLPSDPLSLMSSKKSKVMQKASLLKSQGSNPPLQPSSLSHLTTKKINEIKMKQLSDSINMTNQNDSLLMQRTTTAATIPKPILHLSLLKSSKGLATSPLKRANDAEASQHLIDLNRNMELNDKLNQFILNENKELKQLNETYKQMLDSAFYFINSLSYAQNTQKEYDVNYYTGHVNELNNALLDLERTLKGSLEQAYQVSLQKEKELKDKEEEIKEQLLLAFIKEKNDLLASFNPIREIDFFLLAPIKEEAITQRNIFPSFGNDMLNEELIANQKEVYSDCNKNCIACLVGANNSTRGYSPMKYNPYQSSNNRSSLKKKAEMNRSNSGSNCKGGKNPKPRSTTPQSKALQFSNQD